MLCRIMKLTDRDEKGRLRREKVLVRNVDKLEDFLELTEEFGVCSYMILAKKNRLSDGTQYDIWVLDDDDPFTFDLNIYDDITDFVANES